MNKLFKRIYNWAIRLFKRPKVEKPPELPLQDIKDPELANIILWQSLMLQEDEVLVYKDDNGVVHYFTTAPIQPDKDYKVLYLE